MMIIVIIIIIVIMIMIMMMMMMIIIIINNSDENLFYFSLIEWVFFSGGEKYERNSHLHIDCVCCYIVSFHETDSGIRNMTCLKCFSFLLRKKSKHFDF